MSSIATELKIILECQEICLAFSRNTQFLLLIFKRHSTSVRIENIFYRIKNENVFHILINNQCEYNAIKKIYMMIVSSILRYTNLSYNVYV